LPSKDIHQAKTLPPPPSQRDKDSTNWDSQANRSSATLIPGYEILGVLGRGGMGIVYKARQVGLNRIVALKMILAGGHASHAELQRFHTEAEAVASLHHPNIVQIHDMGVRDGRPYFSLEYCDGGSLQGRLDGTPLSPQAAARLARTLAEAIGYAHQQGIIHRDLKPANILIVEPKEHPLPQCTPKITDFGLAKRLNEDQGHTATEAILGTPSYMAPEQAQGKTKEAGPASDVYALGAILYDLLTGRPPFRGASAIDTLQLVQSAEPVPPSRLQPGVPVDLQTITLKCLEKDPARRYQSANELATDLQRFLDGKPIEARPSSILERTIKFARRNPSLAALLVLSFLTPLALALVSVWYTAQVAVQRDAALEAKKEAEEARHDAERSADEAVKAKQLAHQERDRANQSAAAALAAQKEAQENFLRVQQAAQRLMHLSEARLRYVAGSEPIRKEILRDTLEMSLLFTQRAESDRTPETLLRAAHAHRLVGEIEERLNHPESALMHYDQSIEYYSQLLKLNAQFAQRLDVQNERVEVLLLRWRVLEATAPECADGVLDEALEQLDQQPPTLRQSWPSRSTRAALFTNRAIYHQNRGRLQDALSDLVQALSLLNQLTRDPQLAKLPHRLNEIRLEEARVTINRASMYLSSSSWQQKGQEGARLALEDCARAMALLDALVKTPGEETRFDPAAFREMGRATTTKGLALTILGRSREAIETAQQAVDRFRRAYKQAPENVDVRQLLALALADLGVAQLKAEKLAAARASLEEAETLLGDLREESPETLIFSLDLARVRTSLGLALLRQGQAKQALPLFRAAREGFQLAEDAEGLRVSRQNLARCLDRAARDALGQPQTALLYVQELVGLRQEWYNEETSWYNKIIPGTLLLLTLQARARLEDDLSLYPELSQTIDEMFALAARTWPGYLEQLPALSRALKSDPDRANRYGSQALRILRAQTRTKALEDFLARKELAAVRALPDYSKTLDALPRPRP
jgi:serine/threonine protein kinase